MASSVLLVLAEAFIIFCGLIIAIAGLRAAAFGCLRLLDLYRVHPGAGQIMVFVGAIAIAIWFEFFRTPKALS